jgi:hypothetical protein
VRPAMVPPAQLRWYRSLVLARRLVGNDTLPGSWLARH